MKQGRESEQGRAGLVHRQRRPQRDSHSDRAKTWKAKRIRRGSPVLVWIGSADGPAFIGKAEITSDAAVQKKILADFRAKYWENRMLGVGPSRAKFDSGNRVAIVITPKCDLPGGFSSAPGTPPPLKMSATVPRNAP